MFTNIVNALFGCWHRHYSFPITKKGANRSPAAALTGTYVVCLDCGQEFPYDWREMKVITSRSGDSNAMTKAIESYAGK